MMCRWRWLAVAWFAGLLTGCGDRDVSGPRLVAGTWIAVRPPSDDIGFPDTLVLDSRGAGLIHIQVYPESPQPTWVASAVCYRMDAGTVLIQYCLRHGPYEGDCEPGVWQRRGRLAADGRLYVGPSSMASSVAPRPWARLRRSHRDLGRDGVTDLTNFLAVRRYAHMVDGRRTFRRPPSMVEFVASDG